METSEVILQLLLGALLGLTGQALRTIVGLKKLNDTASRQKTTFKNAFVTSKFVVSLLIGAVAGILAVISISTLKAGFDFSKQVILTIMAAGYAGTDFIEGFIKKYLPASSDTNANTSGAVGQPSPKNP